MTMIESIELEETLQQQELQQMELSILNVSQRMKGFQSNLLPMDQSKDAVSSPMSSSSVSFPGNSASNPRYGGSSGSSWTSVMKQQQSQQISSSNKLNLNSKGLLVMNTPVK